MSVADPALADLDAFYLEHRLCAELESGVEDVAGGTRVWIHCCPCDASAAWVLASVEEVR